MLENAYVFYKAKYTTGGKRIIGLFIPTRNSTISFDVIRKFQFIIRRTIYMTKLESREQCTNLRSIESSH